MPMTRKLYPPDWRQRRLRILARDKYRCKFCGVMDRTQIIRVGEHYIDTNTGEEYDRAGRLVKKWSFIELAFLTSEIGKNKKRITVVITIMHLDQDEWNHDVDDSRLACACQLHHFAYDRFDNSMRKRYGKQYRRFQLELF